MIRRLSLPVAALFVAAITWFLVQGGVSWAQTTLLGPFATGVNVTTVSSQIIGSNPSRKSIQICNPSATTIVWIAPAPTVPLANNGGSISLPAVSSGTTTCFTPPTGVTGGLGAAWNGISAGGNASVTVLEWD